MAKHSLTRTCAACLIEKPLAAFLVVGPGGTKYGSICATCRGKGVKEKPNEAPREDENRTTRSGMQVGIKERLAHETAQKREAKETKEKNREATKDLNQRVLEKTDRKENLIREEKIQRNTFITDAAKKFPLGRLNLLGQKEDRLFGLPSQSDEKKQLDTKNLEETARQEETTKKTISDINPLIVEPHTTVISHTNPIYEEYMKRLGGQSARGRNRQQQFLAKETPLEKNMRPEDYIEKTPSGPRSKK